MPASYPTSVKTFTNRQDLRDLVVAADVNIIYDEVTAIETELGVNPSESAGWSGSFSNTQTSWSSVSARLQNIEYGLQKTFTERVSTLGGSIVVPSSSSVIGLRVRAASGQTANLVEFRNSSDTLVTAITASGNISIIDGGTA
jgi:hypothetical protein